MAGHGISAARSRCSQLADGACTRANTAALGSASVNGFNAAAQGNGMTVTCGCWDASYTTTDLYMASAAPVNAVKVVATRSAPYFFLGPARTVTATAVARKLDIGAFTGTTLAKVGAGPLNNVLNALLSTSLNLSLASYQGLADARMRIRDLVAALNAGTVDQLLATNVTVAQFAQVMLNALQTTSVANLSLSTTVDAMRTIVLANVAGAQTIALGSVNGSRGLLSIALANTQSALNATISPLDALLVSAEIAQAGKAAINVGGTLNLLAFGSAGDIAPTIHLPLYVDVAPGMAWLVSTQCQGTPAQRYSTIAAAPGIVNVCVADVADLSASSCAAAPAATLVNLPGVLTVKANVKVSAQVSQSAAPTMQFDGIVGNSDDYWYAATPPSVFMNALANLGTSLVTGGLTATSPLPLVGGLLSGVVSSLFLVLNPVLSMVFALLDTILTPVLQVLGVQIGVSTIHDLSLSCGESQTDVLNL